MSLFFLSTQYWISFSSTLHVFLKYISNSVIFHNVVMVLKRGKWLYNMFVYKELFTLSERKCDTVYKWVMLKITYPCTFKRSETSLPFAFAFCEQAVMLTLKLPLTHILTFWLHNITLVLAIPQKTTQFLGLVTLGGFYFCFRNIYGPFITQVIATSKCP